MRRSILCLIALGSVLVMACATAESPPLGGQQHLDRCGPSDQACDSECVNFGLDPANCGGCGIQCAAGEVCSAGSCGTSCWGNESICDGRCTSLATDSENCGACGNACPQGQLCSEGSCGLECNGTSKKCGDSCADLRNDTANCGSCGFICAVGEQCVTGECTPVCSGEFTNCGGSCVDTQTNPSHCGACGVTCTESEACVGGSCVSLGQGGASGTGGAAGSAGAGATGGSGAAGAGATGGGGAGGAGATGGGGAAGAGATGGTGGTTACTRTNHATGAAVSASSTLTGHKLSAVNDGVANTALGPNTTWASGSGQSMPQWVELQWSKPELIGRIDVAMPKYGEMPDFDILVHDGTTFVAVAQIRNNYAQVVSATFTNRTTTRVRIKALKAAATTGRAYINEVSIFSNQARDATPSAQSTFAGYSVTAPIDGNRNTALGNAYSWTNTDSLAQWYQLDFGECRRFDRVVLFTTASYPISDYDIQYWDGSSWKTAKSVTGNTAPAVGSVFGEVSATKMRILAKKGPSKQTKHARLNEVEVY